MSEEIERLAQRIAEQAHSGQLDKTGVPYLGHVGRVARSLDDPLDRAVGWLHDVLEDTSWEPVDLVSAGHDVAADLTIGEVDVWRGVVSDVQRLTHRPTEPRADYYARVVSSPRAVRVKLADVADNSDPARLAHLDDATRQRLERKYAAARAALTPSGPVGTGEDDKEARRQ